MSSDERYMRFVLQPGPFLTLHRSSEGQRKEIARRIALEAPGHWVGIVEDGARALTTALDEFNERFPEKAINVGMREVGVFQQNAKIISADQAAVGKLAE